MKITFNKYTKEVDDSLKQFSINYTKEKTEKLKKYIGTKWHVYGLETKVQLSICKIGFNFFENDPEFTFKKMDAIYRLSKSFEGKNLAFIFLDYNYKRIPISTQLQLLPKWVKHVDNWAHSDNLSKFLTRLLEHKITHKELLVILKKWNLSTNLWERRQSLVSLYYYSRTKKEYINYKVSENLISNLLSDKEYFVQKAVGWALRESYNVYPKETFIFIENNIKSISAIAFTTCIEKMNDKQKVILKTKRKK